MSSVTSVSTTPGNSTAGDSKDQLDSPSDRVERLLQKYKRSSGGSTAVMRQEKEAWQLVNDDLRQMGYLPVQFTALSSDHFLLDEATSTRLRGIVRQLVNDVRTKDGTIQELVNALRSYNGLPVVKNTSSPLAPLSFPPRDLQMSNSDGRMSRHSEGSPQTLHSNDSRVTHHTERGRTSPYSAEGHVPFHMTPHDPHVASHDPQADKLRHELAKLEGANAKLQLELQSRPELRELTECHQKIKDLESQLLHYRSSVSLEQSDHVYAHQQVKNIMSVLCASEEEEVVPLVTEMVERLEARNRIQKRLQAVLNILYHPTAPRLPHSRASTAGHDVWCELTWNHALLTLQEWASHLKGLQDLFSVYREVCGHLKLNVPGGGGDSDGEEDDYGGGVLSVSSADMCSLLRGWLLRKGQGKLASTQALVAMVKHFQHLFDVKRPEGVVTKMSQVFQSLEEMRNVMTHIKAALNLDPKASSRELMVVVEGVMSDENRKVLSVVQREFGISDGETLVHKLRMSEEFLPTFQSIATELQAVLGVDSLSMVVPTVRYLKSQGRG